jgi:membrane-bound lytic murein transglycosylase A
MIISVNQRQIQIIFLLVSVLLPACAPRLTIGPSTYSELKLTRAVEFRDVLGKERLKEACIRQTEVLERVLSNNGLTAEKRAYFEEMADITKTMLSGIDSPDFERFISENFEFYRAGEAGSVLFTGYYTPLLHGSRTKDERYQYPVYGVPDDLVFVDLERFGKSGRIKGAVKGRELVPYYRRKEIENGSGFNQSPILYVDDKVALFFLHIQGSGIAQMEDGSTIRLNYADNNGFSYVSIGRRLIEDNEVPREHMSMDAIRDYFMEHPEKIDHYFNQNPSYVFFKEDTDGPYGSTGAVVTPFRSVAADGNYFPKFGPAYIETEIPDGKGEDGSVKTKPVSVLVFDQDSGGAIKGPGRIDIYFGEGEEAAFRAGYMKYSGSLYYLKKKR